MSTLSVRSMNRIAFTSYRDGNAEIYVMKADGTGVKQLTTTASPIINSSAALSPDGKPEAKADDKDEKDSKDKPADKAKEETLKETKGDTAVTLVGDADWVYDQFCARVQRQHH